MVLLLLHAVTRNRLHSMRCKVNFTPFSTKLFFLFIALDKLGL